MSWYKTGTVSVTNGSTTVTGMGTSFVANVSAGFGFIGPDFHIYEVSSVTNDTTLVLVQPYLGTTAPTQAYNIFQTQGIIAGLSTQVANLLTTFGPFRSATQMGGFRNFVINGSMRCAQQATTFALPSGTPTYGSLDQWCAAQSASANGVLNQVVYGASGFQYVAQLGRNVGSTSTGTLSMSTAFETANSIPLQGQSVTLSFYAYAGANLSSSSSSINIAMYTGTGVDQSPTNIAGWTGLSTPIYNTQVLTPTLTRYSFTAALASNLTQAGITFSYGPNGTAGADDNIYITGVQLEISNVASPFENRPYGEELRMCQRQYYTLSDFYVGGYGASGQVVSHELVFPTTMRTIPIVTVGTPTYSNASAYTTTNAAVDKCRASVTVTATGYGSGYGALLTFNSRL